MAGSRVIKPDEIFTNFTLMKMLMVIYTHDPSSTLVLVLKVDEVENRIQRQGLHSGQPLAIAMFMLRLHSILRSGYNSRPSA
jgi:hypothetical protein